MPAVSGRIYDPQGFRKGTVHFSEGQIEEVTSRVDPNAIASGLVLPSFINAHTHLGDSIVLEEPQGTLEEIVKPPDGLKFRRLQAASRPQLQDAMRRSLARMALGGTGAFCDFREGGVEGVKALQAAMEDSPLGGIILGRPKTMTYDRAEVDSLLKLVPGIGLSGVLDWNYDHLQRIAKDVKSKGKLLALHASEAHREDIERVLDLEPDLLVHMTSASDDDWRLCAQEDIPVVVCPRSQLHFGRVPDIPGMLAAGLTLLLGTDNVMFSAPSMLREMEFAYRVAKLEGGVRPSSVLAMAYAGAKLLRNGPPFPLKEGGPSNLLVLDVPAGGDEAYQVIKATEADILLLALGEKIWLRNRGWTERT